MSDRLWGQIIFGLYEVFANIIPGSILLLTIMFFLEKLDYIVNFYQGIFLTSNSFILTIFFFIAFILGQGIQTLGSILEYNINKYKYNGYPSAQFLKQDDHTFPDYFKEKIRSHINELYSTPKDSSPQHIFELCYTYVIQNEINKRVMQFLNMYTFSRNLMATMIIEAIIFFYLTITLYSVYLLIFTILAIVFIYVSYKRFVRYAESFSKEVYRSYFIDACK